VTSKVLQYTSVEDIQDNYYWCGPTSTHMVLSTGGVNMTQQQCATELGTTTDGTGDISDVLRVLNAHLPNAYYMIDYPNPTDAEVLWQDIKHSIDIGFGCVFNICVPPSNYPIGVLGSTTPSYGGGTVYHYITGMGYNDDNPNHRCVYIADPGFRPFTYWVTLNQLVTMIPPKGYAWANAPVPQKDPLEELMADNPTNQQKLDVIYDKLTAYARLGDIPGATQGGNWVSRARYASEPRGGVPNGDTVGMMLYTDANGYDLMVEFAASQGYGPARQAIAARAKAHPEDAQAVFYANKYPA
jgi:hypothetical protein